MFPKSLKQFYTRRTKYAAFIIAVNKAIYNIVYNIYIRAVNNFFFKGSC